MSRYILLKWGILGALIVFICTIYLVFAFQPTPVVNEGLIASNVMIPYPPEYNFRQSINDCGPFNVAAVVRALKREPVSSEDFAESMKWRLQNRYTLPWGLEKQLKENGIKIETPMMYKLSDEDKIKYLEQQLSY